MDFYSKILQENNNKYTLTQLNVSLLLNLFHSKVQHLSLLTEFAQLNHSESWLISDF